MNKQDREEGEPYRIGQWKMSVIFWRLYRLRHRDTDPDQYVRETERRTFKIRGQKKREEQ
jgi:hypothetical protein